MAFNKETFIEEIRVKAFTLGLEIEVEYELEKWEKKNKVEYLYIVRELVKSIKDKNIPCQLIRLNGGASIIAYILGISEINPVKHHIVSEFYFDNNDGYEYDKPYFGISVPTYKKEEAKKILDSLSPIKEVKKGFEYCFGDNGQYQIDIYGSSRLNVLHTLSILTDDNYKDIPLDDPDIIEYMIKKDDKGYYLPNLSYTLNGVSKEFYQLLECTTPKSLYDLAKLECFSWNIYKNRKSLVTQIKEHQCVDYIPYSKEQLFNILTEEYDIAINDALLIIRDLISKKGLREWESLLLSSYEVPKEYFIGIKYLHYLSCSLISVQVAYYLTYYKIKYPDLFSNIINRYKIKLDSYIGIFFYIDGKIIAHKISPNNSDPFIRFVNDDMSHLVFFELLNVIGDYGHYSRGRVIYDRLNKQYIVYIDKDLNYNK